MYNISRYSAKLLPNSIVLYNRCKTHHLFHHSSFVLIMSKAIKVFGEKLFKNNLYKKLYDKQTPGKRIAPVQAGTNDADFQMRLDAGESQNGVKKVYLQVNSQAKNEALKKFREKNGTHANLAVGTIDEGTSPENQKSAAETLWTDLEGQAKGNLP